MNDVIAAALTGSDEAVAEAVQAVPPRAPAPGPREVALLFDIAERLRRRGRYAPARLLLDLIERLSDGGRDARRARAARTAITDEVAAAAARERIAGLRRAAARVDDVEVAQQIARKWRRKDTDVATAYAQRAAELAPTCPNLVVLGACLRDAGDLPGAEAAHRQALRRKPGSATARVALAAVLVDLGDGRLDEAERLATEALRILPGDPAAHRTRATIYSRQGRAEEAKREYERAYRGEEG